MRIDWAQVNWLYLGLLVVLVFLTSYLGTLLSFRRRGWGALISAVLFAAIFVLWTYYPHGLPLPHSPLRTVAAEVAPAAPAPAPVAATPAVAVRPANPVQDITPAQARPANPVQDITPPRQ